MQSKQGSKWKRVLFLLFYCVSSHADWGRSSQGYYDSCYLQKRFEPELKYGNMNQGTDVHQTSMVLKPCTTKSCLLERLTADGPRCFHHIQYVPSGDIRWVKFTRDLTRNTVYCNLLMEALFSYIKPSESTSVWTTSKKWFGIEGLKLFLNAQFECAAKIINIVKLTQIKLPQA